MPAIMRRAGRAPSWNVLFVLLLAVLLGARYRRTDASHSHIGTNFDSSASESTHHSTKRYLEETASLVLRADGDDDTNGGGSSGAGAISAIPSNPDKKLTFEVAVAKGNNLATLMHTQDLEGCGIEQSKYTEYAQLHSNGWQLVDAGAPNWDLGDENEDETIIGADDGVGIALELLQLPDGNNMNQHYELGQPQEVTIDGKEYPASSSAYINVINKAGAIFALSNFSPAFQGARMKPPFTSDQLTPLQTWADVVFLAYQDACGSDPACLRKLFAVVQCSVASKASQNIVDKALGGGDNLKRAPGQTFRQGSDGFNAILATPNGRGTYTSHGLAFAVNC